MFEKTDLRTPQHIRAAQGVVDRVSAWDYCRNGSQESRHHRFHSSRIATELKYNLQYIITVNRNGDLSLLEL